MTGRSNKRLSVEQANEMIAEVNAFDRRQARKAISDGVQVAQSQWIAAPLITEALALELFDFVKSNRSGAEAAGYLRALARALETRSDIQ